MRKLEVCGTLSQLTSWLARFVFFNLSSKNDAYIGVMQLLVRARVRLLTFCFKVLLEVGVGHTGCYLKGLMKCIVN